MFAIFRFLFLSENKAIYRKIASENQVSPLRVYRLAHGKKAKNNKDYKILKSLRKEGIIEGMLQW